MKHLFAVLLLGVASLAHAAPDCLPGDPEADSAIPHVYASLNPLGGGLYVYCDVGHRWALSTRVVVGSASEFDPAVIKAAVEEATRTKDWAAAYNAVKAQFTSNPSDAVLLAGIRAEPLPEAIPPSGLVTTDRKVYSLNQPTNGSPVMGLAGTAPLGTPCDPTQRINGLYRIDRTKVKIPTGALYPKTTWGKCD